MNFLDNEHEKRFLDLIQRDGTHSRDTERYALFYIVSGPNDLYRQADKIYDFEDKCIRPDILDRPEMTSGSRALTELAFNLFNRYESRAVMDLFAPMDRRNRKLAVNAIKLRFRIGDD